MNVVLIDCYTAHMHAVAISHAVPGCKVTMYKLLLGKILHSIGNLQTHADQTFLCVRYLCIDRNVHWYLYMVANYKDWNWG